MTRGYVMPDDSECLHPEYGCVDCGKRLPAAPAEGLRKALEKVEQMQWQSLGHGRYIWREGVLAILRAALTPEDYR